MNNSLGFAFIVNNYPPKMGGLESHVSALATELASRGHRVFVFCLNSTPKVAHRTENGVFVTTLPEHFRVDGILGFPLIGTRRRLTKFLKQSRVDVVSIHTRFFPMTILGARAAMKARVPSILTEHGSDHVSHPSKLIATMSRLVDLTLGRYALRISTRVLGVSDESAKFAARLSGRPAETFFNAIAALPPVPAPQSPTPERFVFVGRLVPGKGWEAFLRLVQKSRELGFPVTGDVLGDGAVLAELKAKVSKMSLDPYIKIHGRVAPEVVRQVLYGATLVNPTTLSEGFQTTLLEAVASHAQIITYPVPGANRLQDAGAMVRITTGQSESELLEEAIRLLKEPNFKDVAKIADQWSWPVRATEYCEIAEDTRTSF